MAPRPQPYRIDWPLTADSAAHIDEMFQILFDDVRNGSVEVTLPDQITGTLDIGHGGTGATTFSAGSVVFAGASALAEDHAHFYWDDTNDRLGLNTTTPATTLDVNGAVQATSMTAASITDSGLTSGRVVIAGAGGLLTGDADLTFSVDTLSATKIASSSLTSGRVPFASTSGLLVDDADLTFSVDTLSATKIASSSLTSGRVPFASTSGLLVDDADLTFSVDTLTATKLFAPTSVKTTVVIGPDPTGPLLLRSTSGTGTGGSDIVFQAGTNGATEIARMLNSGNVGIGHTNAQGLLHLSGAGKELLLTDGASNAAGFTVRYQKSRGSVASPSIVSSGDIVGQFNFMGHDGAAYQNLAVMTGEVDGTPGSGSMPGRFVIATTPSGSASATERLRIDSTGRMGIGVTPTAVLHLKAGSATANTAPIKLTSGSLLTSAEAGAIEFLTDKYYGTITTGTARRTFAFEETTARIVASGRATSNSAAVSSVASYTVGSADGSFIVSANVSVLTAVNHNFTVECAYTDENGNARTLTLTLSNTGGTLVTAIANAGGAIAYAGVPLHIRVQATKSITIRTQAAGNYTNVSYNFEGYIQQIG